MILEFNLPDRFIPLEKEFQIYCAIILYKKNYITKEELIEICEINGDNIDNKIYALLNNFEKRYKNINANGYNAEDL